MKVFYNDRSVARMFSSYDNRFSNIQMVGTSMHDPKLHLLECYRSPILPLYPVNFTDTEYLSLTGVVTKLFVRITSTSEKCLKWLPVQ